jgi:uncharacterized surface protein with fasciclin (FAS1) repeats
MRTKAISKAGRTGMIAAGLGTLVLAAAACGTSAPATPAASTTHHPMASHSPAAESATFGSDCGMIPASGMGSMHGMMTDPVVTAASHNPLLTTLAADIKAAGLTSALDSMGSITVFSPANAAFAKVPHSMTMSLMHSPDQLARVLKYHVVSGRVTTAQLASGKPLTTLEGGTLKPSKMGAVYEVNDADVICGNIQTANATVYIINKVLTPGH